ncbi:MAG: SDR family oxidoreductase [Gammaproteobacteria bacterium]|jgi:NAD(P)-dependent dehydrogenase (short-subunit alcohol dehydrogenase family)|nr:SDR family oxidoreductase [Gammaproteobacteria bacterium]MBT4607180.1 SDR family oxidoreductase [Thiotrichales bacterium]MBT3472516.1 SDR family oxidoreductase [Gammaproteobacteria bacterium]MBT3966756.1 SDR family oxidoreductase [Gammaproteobacteria bacterium]MBT4081957.1 SDR family oxidoreductase [Gammaproteobacteria bacterium]
MADSQKTILITGCSSGIGLRCAEILKQRGWRVFASARNRADVEQLQGQGFESLQLDLDDSHSIQSAVKRTLELSGGTLDALFNNGAYGQPGAVEDLSRDTLRRQFETNLFGTAELINSVIPTMRRQGHGRIVQNSSVLGFVVMPYRGAYNASKFALEGLTDTLRLELKGTGIHLSLIQPGPIESKFRSNAFQAFKAHIDPTNSPHRANYEAMEQRLQKPGPAAPFTLPADAVAKKLIHALESRHPKSRYPVTFPTYLFAFLKRLLPDRWLDTILLKASGDGKR